MWVLLRGGKSVERIGHEISVRYSAASSASSGPITYHSRTRSPACSACRATQAPERAVGVADRVVVAGVHEHRHARRRDLTDGHVPLRRRHHTDVVDGEERLRRLRTVVDELGGVEAARRAGGLDAVRGRGTRRARRTPRPATSANSSGSTSPVIRTDCVAASRAEVHRGVRRRRDDRLQLGDDPLRLVQPQTASRAGARRGPVASPRDRGRRPRCAPARAGGRARAVVARWRRRRAGRRCSSGTRSAGRRVPARGCPTRGRPAGS